MVATMRGILNNIKDLQALFKEFPEAPFFMILRNNNLLTDIRTFGLYIESEEEDGRAYVYGADITSFLPADTIAFLNAWGVSSGEHKFTLFKYFKDAAPLMARKMKREVVLIHMYGSGRQEEASYETFRFKPR